MTAARIVVTIETCQIINHPRFWFLDLSSKEHVVTKRGVTRQCTQQEGMHFTATVFVSVKFSWQSYRSRLVPSFSFRDTLPFLHSLTSLAQMRVRKRTCVSFIRRDADFREVKYFPGNDLV